MSIKDVVRNTIKNGFQYIEVIAKVTGYTSLQVYDASQALLKSNEIQRVIPGHNGAVVLIGEKLNVVSDNVIELNEIKQEPIVEKFTVGFDFNNHFDEFIEKMSHALIGQIQQRVEGELKKFSDNIGNEVANIVRTSSEGIIGRINNQLQEAVKTIGDVSINTKPVCDVIAFNQQPPKQPIVEQSKVRLPRICVAGMLPIHAGRITEEFQNTFDLVFWNDRTGSSSQQLQDYSQNCEVVFWHTKHCSHSDEAIVRKYSNNIIRVNGALTNMRTAIQNYYLKNQISA